MSRDDKRDWFTPALVVLCLALAVLVVLLARQNRALKEELATHAHTHSTEEALKPGDALGELILIREDGVRVPFEPEPDRPAVLLVFSLSCPACEVTLPAWEAVAPELAGAGYQVLGIEADRAAGSDSQDSLLESSLPFPVYGVERRPGGPMDKIPGIPATLLVDPSGRITFAHYGALSEDELRALLSAS